MNIGIVGGGINGLFISWELSKLGLDVSVYEENGYVGGYVWTCFRTITNHKSQTIR